MGGKLNVSVNCLDRHLSGPRKNKAALIWEGEPGDQRTLTYRDLHREVCKFANVLKSLGVKKGDRVTLYLPMIPELPVAMLACARIGAIHSVVFGGFSAESLRDRINDQKAKVLVTADGGWRRGNVVPLKQISDEALEKTPSIRARRRREAHGHGGQDAERPRPVVARPDERRAAALPARENGRRGSPLHPLYVRHDGEAEGHSPHHRRLSGRRVRDVEVDLRSEGRGRLLVHGRHRLGHRATPTSSTAPSPTARRV